MASSFTVILKGKSTQILRQFKLFIPPNYFQWLKMGNLTNTYNNEYQLHPLKGTRQVILQAEQILQMDWHAGAYSSSIQNSHTKKFCSYLLKKVGKIGATCYVSRGKQLPKIKGAIYTLAPLLPCPLSDGISQAMILNSFAKIFLDIIWHKNLQTCATM